MINRIIAMALAITASMMLSCKDTIEDTMYHRDYETGAWDRTKWNRATFEQ